MPFPAPLTRFRFHHEIRRCLLPHRLVTHAQLSCDLPNRDPSLAHSTDTLDIGHFEHLLTPWTAGSHNPSLPGVHWGSEVPPSPSLYRPKVVPFSRITDRCDHHGDGQERIAAPALTSASDGLLRHGRVPLQPGRTRRSDAPSGRWALVADGMEDMLGCTDQSSDLQRPSTGGEPSPCGHCFGR